MKNINMVLPFLFCGVLSFDNSWATPPSDTDTAPATERSLSSVPNAPRLLYPAIEPKNALAGQALLVALRKGGYVLYMRHTQTGEMTEICTKSNLTIAGERDAARLGRNLTQARIPIGKILSSDKCRVIDTAKRLDLGEVTISDALTNHTSRESFDFHAARGRLLAERPAKGTNALLVGHLQAGNVIDQAIYLDFGEIVIFSPDGKGSTVPIGRIQQEDWHTLLTSKEIEK